VVAVLADGWDRYRKRTFDDAWMARVP